MKYIYTVCYLLFVITEPEPRLEDLTGVELYVALCERIGIVPLSCVKNNIHKTHFHMPHRGIGAKGVQALAPPIAVSIQCILTIIFCFRCVLIFRGELWEKLVSGLQSFNGIHAGKYGLSMMSFSDNFDPPWDLQLQSCC